MDQPLVSIIVITYNSSRFIYEFLESAKHQTYRNIELIVTDDCSQDNTVLICENWLKENKNYFVRTEIVTTPINTGTSANCNRGLFRASGEWIKYIAGDDKLMANCIEDNINFVKNKNEVNFIFSDGYRIDEYGRILRKIGPSSKIMNQCVEKQFKHILKEMFVPPVSSFIRKSTLLNLGGFCEETPFIEDHSLFIKAIRNGNKLYHLPKYTVLYRKHENSTTLMIGEKRLNNKHKIQFAQSVINLYNDDFLSDAKRMKMYRTYFHAKLNRLKFNALIKDEKYSYFFISSVIYLDPVFSLQKLMIFFKRIMKYGLLLVINHEQFIKIRNMGKFGLQSQ